MFYKTVITELQRCGIPHALVGGLAVNLHGASRGTFDMDLITVIDRANFQAIEACFAGLGLRARLPISAEDLHNFRSEYIEKRNLVAWSFVDPDNAARAIDVVITHDLTDIDTIEIPVGNTAFTVVTKDALIAMKKEAGRPQDLEDIKALEKL